LSMRMGSTISCAGNVTQPCLVPNVLNTTYFGPTYRLQVLSITCATCTTLKQIVPCRRVLAKHLPLVVAVRRLLLDLPRHPPALGVPSITKYLRVSYFSCSLRGLYPLTLSKTLRSSPFQPTASHSWPTVFPYEGL
jgi:hypothetical protein